MRSLARSAWGRRVVALALAAAGAAGGGLLGLASPAQAYTSPGYGVVGTGSASLIVRAGPSAAAIAVLRDGTAWAADCAVRGRAVGDGDPVWQHLISPVTGYIADYWTDTPGPGGPNQPFLPGEPTCGAAASPGRALGLTRQTNIGDPGQCTWGAYDEFQLATGVYPALSGDAKDWATAARATHWTVVTGAQPRSIVVFQPGIQGADGLHGHVGWVESVERRSDGLYVHILEMNGPAGPYRWDRRVVKDVAGMSYILAP
jgi:hypothetical protein